MERMKGTIRDFMDYIGLPKHACFSGFCVHHEDKDEFLCLYQRDDGKVLKAWSKTPENAISFGDQLEAEQITKDIGNGTVTAAIFDIGDRLLVHVM